MAEFVRSDTAGGVARITLDSPHNRNALSASVRAELSAALDAAAADDAARVVVIGHTGPVFCSGMDLKEEAVAPPGAEGVRELPAILQKVARCPKPVIARIGGPARAGGLGILAAADIAVAAPSATFAFSEVRIGLIPAVISVPVLHRVAPAAARELLLTGDGLRRRPGAARSGWSTRSPTTWTPPSPATSPHCCAAGRPRWPGPRSWCWATWTTPTSGTRRCSAVRDPVRLTGGAGGRAFLRRETAGPVVVRRVGSDGSRQRFSATMIATSTSDHQAIDIQRRVSTGSGRRLTGPP